jgi:hypothetical protein
VKRFEFFGDSEMRISSESLAQAGNTLTVVQEIRRMPGVSQSQLMRCADDQFYVVKFPNNPQGSRILANELIGGRLAALLGLPVAKGEIVFVYPEMMLCSDGLYIELPTGRRPCQSGLCFGSRFVADPRLGVVLDFFPDELLKSLVNLRDFCGMLVFDVWTSNTDQRQAVFHRKPQGSRYRATMIDQGSCFNGDQWSFPNWLRCLYRQRAMYHCVRDVKAFEPWLSRLDKVTPEQLREVGEAVPPEWYGRDHSALAALLDRLDKRRAHVRGLLRSIVAGRRDYFPRANQGASRQTGGCCSSRVALDSDTLRRI